MKTFDEILSEIETIATEKFDLANIKYSKTGVLGFLVYLLSYLRYDVKNYYDYLFRESNIITAQTRDSLLKFASIFGYIPTFARPATFIGNMIIYVPNTNDSNDHHVYIPKHTEFIVNDMIWTLYDVINITYNNLTNTGIANIIKEDGSRINIPVKLQTLNNSTKFIVIPGPTIRQEKYTSFKYKVPFYYYGSFHKIQLKAQDFGGKYFSKIKVHIKTPDINDFIEYQIAQNKYLYSGNDNVVFIEYKDEDNIAIILGSGINGKYIPEGSEVIIDVYTTNGSVGNINANVEILLRSKDKVLLDNVLVTNPEFVKLLTSEQINSGADIQTINELKKDIITYIKTRDTIITKDDIISILENYNIPSYIVTRTYKLFTPTIYVYATLISPLLVPIKHTTYYLSRADLENPLFINEGHGITYITKGIYPNATDIQVLQQISSNQIKLSSTENLNINDKINFAPDYYIKENDLYTITSIDTENSIITLNKEITFNPAGKKIYKYTNLSIQCSTLFMAVYDKLFNRYRTYIVNNNFTLVLNELNNQNFIYTPEISLKINNISIIDETNERYSIELKLSIANKNEFPREFIDTVTDEIIIQIPNIGITLTTNDIINNEDSSEEITLTYDQIYGQENLFEFLDALEHIEIKYNVKNITTNETIASYNLSAVFIINTSDLLTYTILPSEDTTIYDIPIIEKSDYEMFKDYIKQKIIDLAKNKSIMTKTPAGVEYKILLSNSIESPQN